MHKVVPVKPGKHQVKVTTVSGKKFEFSVDTPKASVLLRYLMMFRVRMDDIQEIDLDGEVILDTPMKLSNGKNSVADLIRKHLKTPKAEESGVVQ